MTQTPVKPFVILSVDDDDNAHLLMRRAFAKSKIAATLITLNDGIEAVLYLSAEGKYSDRTKYPMPNLMLLDLKMPRLSGFGVLENIRKQPTLQNLPVIVFSSSDNEEDVKKAHQLGCSSYVVKPTDFEKLLQFVESLQEKFISNSPQATTSEPSAQSFSQFAVTEKKQHPQTPRIMNEEKPITDSPEMFKLLVEQVKDYAIFMIDTKGTVLSWNEGARRLKGYEPKEIIGKHFSIFYPQQDVESDKPQFELRMAVEMGRYEDEGWRVRKDGSRFWANVVISPLKDKHGRLAGYAKVTRDLTQRKFHEEGLQRLLETEERFRLLVEQVKDYAIFILDAKGNVASWNQGARRLKGYTADEILGKHFSTFYTEADLERDHPAKELSIAIREGRYEEEGWRVRKDGSQFWASVVITSLWDKRGNLSGFAKVTRDLTQKKEESEALQHKTEELEAFAHTLSHDLRAPLRSILSFAQILKTDAEELSQQEKNDYLDKILRGAQSMDSLMRGVLEYSQLSLASSANEAVPLVEVIDETVRLFESDILKSRAQVDIKKPLPVIQGNRTLLSQIFSNLLNNALKFVPEGQSPKVEIFGTRKNGTCEIHVKDSGMGIPEKYHHSIFQMFDRGPASSGFAGTGVGLAIVKKAVERLGGKIVLRSKPGEGAEFIITLPVSSSSAIHSTVNA